MKTIAQWVLIGTVLLSSTTVFAQLQNVSPAGGADVTLRRCHGGPNDGLLCNGDSACPSGVCDPYNILHFTVNFLRLTAPIGGLYEGWTPTAEELATIREEFETANDEVFDVTDGQFVIGTLSFVYDNQAPGAMLQYIRNEPSAVTDTGEWGSGGRLNIGSGCLSLYGCFVHELMHMIGNVKDEYQGFLPNGVDDDGDDDVDECEEETGLLRCFGGEDDGEHCVIPMFPELPQPCPGGNCWRIYCGDTPVNQDPATITGPIMQCCDNNYTTEMCTDANHDLGSMDTEQSLCRDGRSTWSQFCLEWPDVVKCPDNLPDPGPETAPNDITFFEPSVLDRTVAVIDRSGSMSSEDPSRISVARNALHDFVNLLSEGSEFGLVSFSGSVDGPPEPEDSVKNYPSGPGLATIGSDRSVIHTAIEGVDVDVDGWTRIAAGLLTARDAFWENNQEVTVNSSILLLTDALNNRALPEPEADLQNALNAVRDDGINLFVTCIGQARDYAQCADIADYANGRFVDSADTPNLYDTFVDYLAQAEGREIVKSDLSVPISNGEIWGPIDIVIEPDVSEARFILSWKYTSSDLNLYLSDPNGDIVDPAAVINGSQGEFYKVETPAPGVWQMLVEAPSIIETDEALSIRTLVENDSLYTSAKLLKQSIVWSETGGFEISVLPKSGWPITNCDVQSIVTKPDNSTEIVSLEETSCREKGVYSTRYRNVTAGKGIYSFDVKVHCEEGIATRALSTEPGLGMTGLSEEIETFARNVRLSGILSGDVPEDLPPLADICHNGAAECSGETTPVELDGTCSSDPENSSLSYTWSSPTGTFASPNDPNPIGEFPVGVNTVSLIVEDAYGNISVPDTTTVTIRDSVSPELNEPSEITVSLCDPLSESVVLDIPSAVDVCVIPTITGEIVEENGVPLSSPIPISDTGVVELSFGRYTAEWTASDGTNATVVHQIVNVVPSVFASSSIDVRDRADVEGVLTAGGDVTLGVEAKSDGILNTGNVILNDRCTIDGDIITAGTIQYGNDVNPNGSETTGASVTLPEQIALETVVFPSSGLTDKSIFAGESESLAPNMYGDVSVSSQGTLYLKNGEYQFAKLHMESDSVINLSQCTDAVYIVVNDGLVIRGSFQNAACQVIVGYQGDDTVVLEAPFEGTLIAPLATVQLEKGAGNTFAGQIFANDLQFRPDVIFDCQLNLDVNGSADYQEGDAPSDTDSDIDTESQCTCDVGCDNPREAAGVLGTQDAVCFAIGSDIAGWFAWAAWDRTISVNGQIVTNGGPLPDQINDTYYFYFSSGSNPMSRLSFW